MDGSCYEFPKSSFLLKMAAFVSPSLISRVTLHSPFFTRCQVEIFSLVRC